MFCKVTADLNAHLSQLDREAAWDEYRDQRTEECYGELYNDHQELETVVYEVCAEDFNEAMFEAVAQGNAAELGRLFLARCEQQRWNRAGQLAEERIDDEKARAEEYAAKITTTLLNRQLT